MTVTWEVHYEFDFNEQDINDIVEQLNSIKVFDDNLIDKMIDDVVAGWDDRYYYAFNKNACEQIRNEIKKRLGGVQLSFIEGVN